MQIRKATILDFEPVYKLAVEALEYLSPGKEIDEDHIRFITLDMIKNHIVLVAEKEEIVGILGAVVNSNIFYPKETHLLELVWFVTEEARMTSAAMRLFKEFINLGKELNVTRIVMSVESHSPLSDDVYTKRGFELKEKAFVMEV
jgi:L-amino acid N-acyltransferase YncA